MRYSFDLIEKPWIPCVMTDGGTIEFGLRGVLANAREIREIRDASPVVNAALHRLLLAILHRNFGPAIPKEWLSIWQGGHGLWEVKKLDVYFNRWRERFDLLHPERPFYQLANFTANETTPISRLYHELTSGNNPTLFDHSIDEAPPAITLAEAARILVAHQAFAVGGGRTPTGYSVHSPLIGGVVVLFQGDTLFETLMLNLIAYNPAENEPFAVLPGHQDLPAWEREEPVAPGTRRQVTGYLDFLTWQSRAIRLLPEGDHGNPRISRAYYGQGEDCIDEQVDDPQVPMLRDREEGFIKLRLNPDRALWRDSTALLNRTSTVSRPVKACSWLADLMLYHGALDETKEYRLNVYGLATDKAKILLWREEELPLPLRYLEDAQLTNDLALEVEKAEGGARAIGEALYTLALHLLYPEDEMRKRGVDQNKVRAMIRGFSTPLLYWSKMERHFYELIRGLVVGRDEAALTWRRAIKKEARWAFNETVRGLGGSARVLKAAIRGQATLNGALMDHLGREEEVISDAG